MNKICEPNFDILELDDNDRVVLIMEAPWLVPHFKNWTTKGLG